MRSVASKAHGFRDAGMMIECYADGTRIVSADAAVEFGLVLHELYKFQIEAPRVIIEACGIFDSNAVAAPPAPLKPLSPVPANVVNELGIEADNEGLPPEAYEKGRWN